MSLSWERFFFQANYGTAALVIFLLIFIVTNHTFSKKIAILFIIALVLDIILIFTDNVRFYTYRMDHPTVYRYLAAACGYSLRPAIIYFLTLLVGRNFKKNNLLLAIPAIINSIIAILSCFGPTKGIMFSYNEMNVFTRGLLSYFPYFVSAIYLFCLLYFSIKNYSYNAYETLIVTIMVLCGCFAAFMESVFKFDLILSHTMADSIVFFYLFLNVQIYKRDSLTQLLNRRCFYLDLNRNKNKKMIFVSMDLNYLKYFNDTFGHSEGDKALITVSSIMIKNFSRDAIVYRTGGDEFFAIFDGKSIEYVQKSVEKFQKAIAQTQYSIACGIESYTPGNNLDDIISRADEKMYENKVLIKSKKKMN